MNFRNTSSFVPMLLAVSSPLVAQSPASDIDTVTVEGARRPAPTPSIGGLPLEFRETQQSMSVFDASQIEQQGSRTLIELLGTAPGVSMQMSTSDEYYYTIRGQSVESYSWDGLTMTNTSFLTADPNMDVIEQVEILRGGNTIVGGASGFGGINMIRKKPTKELQISTKFSSGSWDQKHTMFDVSGPLGDSGRVRGRTVVSLNDRDFYYDVAHRRNRTMYGVLEFDVTDNLLLTASAHYVDLDSKPIIYGYPFYSDGRSLDLPRETYLNPAWTRFDLVEQNQFVSLEHTSKSGWKTRIAVDYQDAISHYRYEYASGAVNPATNMGPRSTGQFHIFNPAQTSFRLSTVGTFNLFGREHDLQAGVDYQHFWRTHHWRDNGATVNEADPRISPVPYVPWDVFDFDPYSVPERPDPPADVLAGGYTGWGRITTKPLDEKQKGVYVGTNFHLSDNVHLQVSGRLSSFDYTGTYLLFPSLAVFSNFDTHLSSYFVPQAGITWDFSENWSTYASYSEIFTPQTNADAAGRVLDPREGINLEWGVKGELGGGRLNVSGAVFLMTDSNRPELDLSDPSGTAYFAGGETRNKGFELSASGEIRPGWTFNGGYVFNEGEITRANLNVGQRPNVFEPEQMLRLWTDYTLPGLAGKVSVGGGLEWQSEIRRPTINNRDWNTVPWMEQGAYALAKLRVGYRPSEKLRLAFNVNNLFDEWYYTYIHSDATARAMWGEPRTFFMTATYDVM